MVNFIKKCDWCKREFFSYPSEKRKFCSRKCMGKSYSKRKNVKCRICNNIFKVQAHVLKQGYGKYCSKKCYKISKEGASNINWEGGIKKCSNGYIWIKCKHHPRADNQNYIYEHILIAEMKLGRHLTPDECIHHINEIRDDNRPENLYLFPSKAEHMQYHLNLYYNKINHCIFKSNLG